MKKQIKILLPVMLAGKMFIPGTPEKPKIVSISATIAADLVERGIAEYVPDKQAAAAK